MNKYEFPLEVRVGSIGFVPLGDLTRALRTRDLSGQVWSGPPQWRTFDPCTKRFVSARSPLPVGIWESMAQSDAIMLDELQTGSLRTHVPVSRGAVRAIPPEYWSESFASLSVGGTLLDLTDGAIVPSELQRSQIVVLEEPAYRWLIRHKINAKNPDYPRSLRKGAPPRSVELPPDPIILAKLKELIEQDYTRDAASKRIGQLPGFRGVENAHARRILKECPDIRPGRRPKKP
jgi:hypothetical protein